MTASFLSTVPASVRKADASAFSAPATGLVASHPYASDPNEVVVATGKASYTRGQLEAAFRAIQNTEHWKLPIHVAIPAGALDIAMAAATFFTGAGITVETATADRWAVIRGAGYYATVGA